MSNAAILRMPTSGKVVSADMLLAAFQLGASSDDTNISTFTTLDGENGDYFATELRMADLVHQQAGMHPSHAVITMPMVNFGTAKWVEKAFSWYLTGAIKKMRTRMRCACYIQTSHNKSIPLLNGTVVQIQHDIKKGGIVVTVFCDKFLLSKVTCFGQAQYDPVSKLFAYVSNPAFPLVFNRWGWPDCIDMPFGNGTTPVFAPTARYGWKADPQRNSTVENGSGSPSETSSGEPAPGYATTRSRSWRVVDAVKYMRMMHYVTDEGGFPAGILPRGLKVTKGMVWPDNIEQVLAGGGGTDRTLHDCDCEGLTLDAALTKLAHRAGPYELYMLPGSVHTGGDNGNNVGGGALGSAAFDTFGTALNSAVNSLNGAFTSMDGTMAAFTSALGSFQSAFGTAFSSFQSQLSGPYANAAYNAIQEKITLLNNRIAGIGTSLFTSTADAQNGIGAEYAQLVAQLGASLNGNPGHWTLPNGAIIGGADPSASLGTGASTGGNPGIMPVPAGLTFLGLANQSAAQQNGNAAAPKPISTLAFIDLRGTNGQDSPVIPALYGQTLDQAMTQGENAVSAGFWTESIVNYFDAAERFGDAPSYESTFSMSAYDPDGTWLEPAWSDQDEEDFNSYYLAGAGTHKKTSQAFKEACLLYPLVYAAYRVLANYMKKFKNTKWGSYFAGRQHPRILPTLLSGYQEQVDNPQNWIPRPPYLETYGKADDASAATASNWTACGVYDNLQLSQDGQYFMVTALRDGGPGSEANGTPVTHVFKSDPTLGFEKVPIRATLAIELDFRLRSFYNKNSDKDTEDQVGARVQKPRANDQWVYSWIGKDGEYVDWNRYKSYPVGQLIPAGWRVFPDKASNGDGGNLFTDVPTATTGRLAQHARSNASDVRRVEGGGQFIFPRFALNYPPGAGLKDFDKNTGIPFRVCVSSHTYRANVEEASTVETGVASPSDITRGDK